MASGSWCLVPLLWASCHHDVTGCCCPLFAAVVGSVSCCWSHVSCCAFRFRLFVVSGILMACGHCTQAWPCVPPAGLFVFSFPRACHAFPPVGFSDWPVFLLTFLCLCSWLFSLVLSSFRLVVVCLLLGFCSVGLFLLLLFRVVWGFSAFSVCCWSSGAGGCENVKSGFSRVFGRVGCRFENRSCLHGRIHVILGGYGGVLAVFF